MTTYLIPGLLGLLTGLLLRWAGFCRCCGLRSALGLRRSLILRTGLSALGWGVLLAALLMWLAVIDVDTVAVLPLSLGTLLGGVMFGVCAGLCGFTPTTAFAGLGAGGSPSGGSALEALCVLAGCFGMTWLLPSLEGLLAPLRELAPYAGATLFRVTLDEGFLFEGGFLGLGCLGALLAVWGICVPSPRAVIIPDEAIAARAAETPLPSGETPAPDPEDAPAETIIAALEGEEPLVVDAGMDEPDSEESAMEESTPEAPSLEEPVPDESEPDVSDSDSVEEATDPEEAAPDSDKPVE